MSHVGVRRFSVAGALLGLVLATAVFAPVAEANHVNATQLCSAKYAGTFNHLDNRPIRVQSTGERLGRLVLAHQFRNGKNRTCAVVVRNHHQRKRFAGVAIRRISGQDSAWKRKTARSRWGVGPVVHAGRCVSVRGTISKSTEPRSFCYVS
ncbi:MAG: hypothetical protein ACRDOY_12085 [Nocardioidaceae bacterium]